MKFISAARIGVATLALGGVALLAVGASAPVAVGQSSLLQDGKISFVVAGIGYEVPETTDVSAMCPNGTSVGPRDIFAATPEGQRHDGESDADYTRRLAAGSQRLLTGPGGENLCANPEVGSPDPHHPLLTGDVVIPGLDLDGQNSRANGRAAPGTCAHDDFRGANGARGIDNQFMRAVGCTNSLSPGGAMREFESAMLVGEWGILITLENVQDLRNDNDVTVKFYASADPIELSPNRIPLENATYSYIHNPNYQATTHGRIVNGVLTIDPVDTRFQFVIASLYVDRVLRNTRLRVTLNADGSLEGVMAGYTPVEDAYDVAFGFRNNQLGPDGRRAPGETVFGAGYGGGGGRQQGQGQAAAAQTGAGADTASRRARGAAGAASGFAFTARHTCNGVYYALQQMADGDRDPQTGRCSSISTQYRIRAIPAFVTDAVSRSANQDLATPGGY